MKQVGKFTFDGRSVTGPAEYMRERGSAKLEEILAGLSAVFNAGCVHSPDAVTALLVALQTDYAGWRGTRQLLNTLNQKT